MLICVKAFTVYPFAASDAIICPSVLLCFAMNDQVICSGVTAPTLFPFVAVSLRHQCSQVFHTDKEVIM